MSIHPWKADYLFNWVWKQDKQEVPTTTTTKKDIEKCSTCGVKFSSFASPKKQPLQKTNPSQKGKKKM